MIRFYVDEDFDQDVVRGVRRRASEVDLLTVSEDGVIGATDEQVLARAAELERVVLTQDKNTLVAAAYRRVDLGVFVMAVGSPLLRVIEDIILLGFAEDPASCVSQVRYLPL